MSIKKPNTKRKHELIYQNVQIMVNTGKANSVWESCYKISKKLKMSQPAVSMAYYNFRKEKLIQDKSN